MVIPTDQRDPITRTLGSGQKRLGTETRDFGDTVDARPPAASPPPLADDVLRGAAAIAEFLYRTGARAQSSVLASRRCFVGAPRTQTIRPARGAGTVVAEIDEARLVGMECQSIPCKALAQNEMAVAAGSQGSVPMTRPGRPSTRSTPRLRAMSDARSPAPRGLPCSPGTPAPHLTRAARSTRWRRSSAASPRPPTPAIPKPPR
jgi:hypothetical protein